MAAEPGSRNVPGYAAGLGIGGTRKEKPALHKEGAGAGLGSERLFDRPDISAAGEESRSPKPSLGLAACQHGDRAAVL
jgi:hypothetical protein